MYRVSFEVIVPDPEYARRIEDDLRRAGLHIDRYNMEFINDGIQHIHTMDGNVMGVPDHNHHSNVPRSVAGLQADEDLMQNYIDGLKREMELDELIEEEIDKPKDFLEEKDMEL